MQRRAAAQGPIRWRVARGRRPEAMVRLRVGNLAPDRTSTDAEPLNGAPRSPGSGQAPLEAGTPNCSEPAAIPFARSGRGSRVPSRAYRSRGFAKAS
jgi:hypothetical protein